MSCNLFSTLNSVLIVAILCNLTIGEFLCCISTCKLLYGYGNNNGLISNLCHTKLTSIMPVSIRNSLQVIIIPHDELFSCDHIALPELFITLDLQSIGMSYSKKWFLICMLTNVSKLKKSKSCKKSVHNKLVNKVNGYWLYQGTLFIGELKLEFNGNSYISTPVKGMSINFNAIKIGTFDNNMSCTGFTMSSNYVGQTEQDKKHGKGTFIYDDGGIYEGNNFRGIREGQGKYVWTNGCVYDGDWIDNKRHGQGTFTTPHGIPTRDNALHVDIRSLINNDKCTKILADKLGKYCQILFKQKEDNDNKLICQVCLNTCCLTTATNMESFWSAGNNICHCPCKIIEKNTS